MSAFLPLLLALAAIRGACELLTPPKAFPSMTVQKWAQIINGVACLGMLGLVMVAGAAHGWKAAGIWLVVTIVTCFLAEVIAEFLISVARKRNGRLWR